MPSFKNVNWISGVAFLGHVISTKCISVALNKIDSIITWKTSKNVTRWGVSLDYWVIIVVLLRVSLPLLVL